MSDAVDTDKVPATQSGVLLQLLGFGTQSDGGDSRRQTRNIGLVIVLLVGLVIFFPTFQSPLLLDDYLHAAMVDGTFPGKRGIFDLYDFVTHADRQQLIDRGMIPWWADPQLQIRFFRPLASALRWGEHLLIGRNVLWLHLHSFVWWFVAVLSARSLYLRALSPRAALIATFIFALAPCHVMPMAWLANREVFISLVSGVFALQAYIRFRETNRLVHGLAAFVLFAIAFLCGEYALNFAGFVLAVEWGRSGESTWRRLVKQTPFVVPVVVYMFVRAWLGYGSQGTGYYTDPFREPLPFLASAPRRFITLLANAWMSLDYTALDVTTPVWLLLLMVVLGVPLVVVAMHRLYVGLDEPTRRWFWIFGVGSLGALVPVIAVSPSPRLVGTSMLGIAPIVGMLLERDWFVSEPGTRDRSVAAQLSGWATILLAFAHLIHGPVNSALFANKLGEHGREFAKEVIDVRAQLQKVPKNSEVLILRAIINSFYLPLIIDPEGTLSLQWRILAQPAHELVIRTGPRTLDVIAGQEERIFSTRRDNLYRADNLNVRVGDVMTMPGAQITIREVGPLGPRVVRFEFEHDLSAPTYIWIAETSNGFIIEDPLEIGFGRPYEL